MRQAAGGHGKVPGASAFRGRKAQRQHLLALERARAEVLDGLLGRRHHGHFGHAEGRAAGGAHDGVGGAERRGEGRGLRHGGGLRIHSTNSLFAALATPAAHRTGPRPGGRSSAPVGRALEPLAPPVARGAKPPAGVCLPADRKRTPRVRYTLGAHAAGGPGAARGPAAAPREAAPATCRARRGRRHRPTRRRCRLRRRLCASSRRSSPDSFPLSLYPGGRFGV